MKRTGFIYANIYDKENIRKAIDKAPLGKRKKSYVKKIMDNKDYYIDVIHLMLKNKTYVPSPYTVKTIQDRSSGKVREIFKPRFFPDQIVHWSLMQQIQPIIMKGMYAYNCGSIPGRGSKLGQRAIRKWLDNDRKNTKYCLKLDVQKFYPSISNAVLKEKFRAKIKDADCLWLLDSIIDSAEGLPIGNYTSQWFANFLLQGLDHYIKEDLGIKYYVRYVDDLVIFGPNKKKLHQARREIESYLNRLELTLKGNWQVFRVDDRGVDFLGLRFFRNKTILRKRNALRIKRRINKISKKKSLTHKDACAVISYWGWIKKSDSYNFYMKNFKPKVSLKRARKVISEYGKTNHLR